MSVSEVLFKSADVLRKDGWCQGDLINDAGNRCMMGAINQAHSLVGEDIDDWIRSQEALKEVLTANYPEVGVYRSTVIPQVNDDLMKSSDEAIAMLEKAALLEEEAGR